jgi:hypothetical protein
MSHAVAHQLLPLAASLLHIYTNTPHRFAEGQRLLGLTSDQTSTMIRVCGDVSPGQLAGEVAGAVAQDLRVGDNPQLAAASLEVRCCGCVCVCEGI